ncbi:hypothetical protein BV25DRAFT_1919593 [Artomyces pyxidatus]|uniref:Uncharacterized protein n=1 Tax=Artomyces pyxidatus TaxID=48021 RepID=A0ACB8SNC3_9AGAM|nr:hypothetical protein BV25DRAFT_1919593 [Artomyces pyxidatus]
MPAKVPSVIKCDSESDLQRELVDIRTSLSLTETEDTWEKIARALSSLSALSKGGACDYPSAFTSALRSLSRPITSAACSERTRLSGAAIELIIALATGLGTSFEPLVPQLFPTLLSLCSRPNKVFIARAKAGIEAVIDQTQLPSVLPYLAEGLKDKSVSLRLIAIESILACLNCLNPPDLERETRAKDIEGSIKLTATDASAEVRKISRQVFDAYKILLPDRVDSFTSPLSPTAKKYLNIKASVNPNSRPQSAQSAYSTHSAAATRPTSAMSTGAKRCETVARPATAMTHTRSASASVLTSRAMAAPSLPPVRKPAPLARSQTEVIAPVRERPAAAPSRSAAMPPPPTIPVRRAQSGHPTRPPPPAERHAEASSSRAMRPDAPQQRPPTGGPMRPNPDAAAKPMSIKERLMGGARRVPLPEAQRPQVGEKPAAEAKELPKSTAANVKDAPKISPPTSSSSTAKLNPTTSTSATTTSEVTKRDAPPKTVPPSSSTAAVKRHRTISTSTASTAHAAAAAAPAKKAEKRSGGVMQPTLSQLARMKASEHDKKSTAANVKATGTMRPLSIRPKTKPSGDAQKAPSKPATKSARTKEADAIIPEASVPLPASPTASAKAACVPLPPSPTVQAQEDADIVEIVEDQPVAPKIEHAVDSPQSASTGSGPATPAKDSYLAAQSFSLATKTPISTLMSNIQRGFLFSPNSPLSPPQSYATTGSEGEDGAWTYPSWPPQVKNVPIFGQGEPIFEEAMEPPLKGSIEGESEQVRRALVEVDMN